MNPADCKPGALVRYRPIIDGSESYTGTVRMEPWALGHGALVTHLKDLDRPSKPYQHAVLVAFLELVTHAPPEQAKP